MQKLFTFYFLCLSIGILASLPTNLWGQHNLTAYAKNSLFCSPTEGSYIETNLSIPAGQLKFVQNNDGLFSAKVQVQINYQPEMGKSELLNYVLHSVAIEDSQQLSFNIIDIQRMALMPAKYKVLIAFKDLNEPENIGTLEEHLEVVEADQTKLSDILFIESISKKSGGGQFERNGMQIVPNPINFFPTVMDKLRFYLEIYSRDFAGQPLLMRYSIHTYPGGKALEKFSSFKKISNATAVEPITGTFNIAALETGNYELVAELINQENELISKKKLFFQRLNKNVESLNNLDVTAIVPSYFSNMSFDSLAWLALSLQPIAAQTEFALIEGLIESKEKKGLQHYFYEFWQRRSKDNPVGAFLDYHEKVLLVNNTYRTRIQEGFETDRGLLYLKRGKPDEVRIGREPGARDYEIWQYNGFDDGQSNIRYVFVNRTMVNNDYVLVHSTELGEIKNERWRHEIYDTFSAPQGGSDFDNNTFRRTHGSTYTDDLFD